MESQYEEVVAEIEWYDGPREGIAYFNRLPVHYCSEFKDVFGDGKRPDIFRLQSVSAEALQHAVEREQIWLRWNKVFKAGETTEDTCPALPEDRCRYDELAALLDVELQLDEAIALRARADFKFTDEQYHVKWEVITD